MTQPHVTRRECQLLEAIIETGDLTRAAAAMVPPIVYRTAKNYIHQFRSRTGLTTEQAIALGVRDGWLTVHEPVNSGGSNPSSLKDGAGLCREHRPCPFRAMDRGRRRRNVTQQGRSLSVLQQPARLQRDDAVLSAGGDCVASAPCVAMPARDLFRPRDGRSSVSRDPNYRGMTDLHVFVPTDRFSRP